MPPNDDSTCWSLIHRAADADETARTQFVERYYSVAKAYLSARWSNRRRQEDIQDALHDVFAECLRPQGVLGRTGALHGDSFRGFLFGVVRKVAQRHERVWNRPADRSDSEPLQYMPADDESLAQAFDRAWARAVVTEAVALQEERANSLGDEASQRIELIKLRICESVPVRKIAEQWDKPAEWLHRELARGKQEFASCLQEVLRAHLGDDLGKSDQQLELVAELLR